MAGRDIQLSSVQKTHFISPHCIKKKMTVFLIPGSPCDANRRIISVTRAHYHLQCPGVTYT